MISGNSAVTRGVKHLSSPTRVANSLRIRIRPRGCLSVRLELARQRWGYSAYSDTLGLLRATVFRYFLGFLALRGTSLRFTRQV
jgi:hypothetical protein